MAATSQVSTAPPVPGRVTPVLPEERAHPTERPRAGFGPFPAWLRWIDALHRGARTPVTYIVDLALLAAGAALAGASPWMAASLAIVLVLALDLGGGYGDRSSLETQGVLWFASAVWTPIGMTMLGGVALAQMFGWSEARILVGGAFGMGGLIAARSFTGATLALTRRRGIGLYRTLLLGNPKRARLLSQKLSDNPEAGLLPVAILPLRNGGGYSVTLPTFPSAGELTRAIEETGAEHVVLAPEGTEDAILECVKGSDGHDVTFSILPPLSEFFLHPGMVAQVGGLPLIPLGRIARSRRTQPGKRLLDLLFGSIALVLVSPLMAVTALAIRIFDGPQVIYRQRRVGRHGKVFRVLKFRSMVPGVERLEIDLRDNRNHSMAMLFKVNDAARITTIGRIIRRTAIDELPQLWNVIRGDMSLVGPRPTPGVNPEDFNAIDNKRHTVRPGMTGYWQVSGDNALTYEEMVKLDLAYVENWSLWLDLRLLLRTIPALLRRRGPS